jgi:hypothetical protein
MKVPVYQFVKVFTQGLMADLKTKEKMYFVNHEDAIKWLRGVNTANEYGDCDYRVIDFEYLEDKVLGGVEA